MMQRKSRKQHVKYIYIYMNIFLKFENSYKVKKLTIEHSKIMKKTKNDEEKEHSKKEAFILLYARFILNLLR